MHIIFLCFLFYVDMVNLNSCSGTNRDGYFIDTGWFLVKWEGYTEPEWERGRLLERDGCHEAIRSFWDRTGLSPCKDFYDDPEGRNRCDVCAKVCKRPQDLKAHKTRMKHHVDDQIKITETARRDARKKNGRETERVVKSEVGRHMRR